MHHIINFCGQIIALWTSLTMGDSSQSPVQKQTQEKKGATRSDFAAQRAARKAEAQRLRAESSAYVAELRDRAVGGSGGRRVRFAEEVAKESPVRKRRATKPSLKYSDLMRRRQKFAGIWVSDVAPILYRGRGSNQPTQCEGTIAISGRVPFLISQDDLRALTVGDHLFIAPGTDRRYYNRTLRDVNALSDGVFPVAGYASHQQLVVAPVSIAPPGSEKCFWGVPQYAPVVFDPNGNRVPSEYRLVKGAAPNNAIVDEPLPHTTTGMDLDDGLRTFGVVNRAELLRLLQNVVDEEGVVRPIPPDELRVILEDRFIGTLSAKTNDGCAAEVDICAVLVHAS